MNDLSQEAQVRRVISRRVQTIIDGPLTLDKLTERDLFRMQNYINALIRLGEI